MVNWSRFDPEDYGIEFAEEKLEPHDVTVEEAADAFSDDSVSGLHERYRILGRTESGRA